MNPYVIEELARQREQERRGAVRPSSLASRRLSGLRRSVGWMLVEIGLALMQGS